MEGCSQELPCWRYLAARPVVVVVVVFLTDKPGLFLTDKSFSTSYSPNHFLNHIVYYISDLSLIMSDIEHPIYIN